MDEKRENKNLIPIYIIAGLIACRIIYRWGYSAAYVKLMEAMCKPR